MGLGQGILDLVSQRQDLSQFRKKHWEGSFAEYLDLAATDPKIARNAFERVYDMILSYGCESYEVAREKRVHYKFFDDPEDHGADAVFGLDEALQQLVNAFKSAA